MYKLLKLVKVGNYRIYQDFKWDESVTPFTNTNLIFGWNGSGKSTFADLLYQLSNNVPFEQTESFDLLFQDDDSHPLHVTNLQTHAGKYSLMVFDQNYVDRNIAKVDSIKHIFAVGEGQVSVAQQIKDARKQTETCKTKLQEVEQANDKAKKKYDQLLTKHASSLKTELELGNSYNKNTFIQDYNLCTDPEMLSADKYNTAKATLFSSQLPELGLFSFSSVNELFEPYIRKLLKTQPIISAIEILKDNNELAKWTEDGLALHKKLESHICFFCGSFIPENRLAALEAHFNTEYLDLIDKINSSIERIGVIREQYISLAEKLYSVDQFYPELKDQYQRTKDELQLNCQRCVKILDVIISILTSKQKNVVSDEAVASFNDVSDLHLLSTDITNPINELICINNDLSEKHKNIVNKALAQTKAHWFAIYYDDITSSSKSLHDLKHDLETATSNLLSATKEQQVLELKFSSAAIPAKEMNDNIASFLGRTDIQFVDQENGYSLIRKGKLAVNLSRGEKTQLLLFISLTPCLI